MYFDRVARVVENVLFDKFLGRLIEPLPVGENIFIPLSSKGLCEALITIPASKSNSRVRNATPGVVITPADLQTAFSA